MQRNGSHRAGTSEIQTGRDLTRKHKKREKRNYFANKNDYFFLISHLVNYPNLTHLRVLFCYKFTAIYT
ncbi:Uncharacterized protein APZ42_025224 [Daphnia magna]|uniref:Uncharacterized protein n=1 Tax=Daphnia magna TaxID=35525 RepID=A0A164TBZ3_9CRUS|nr:Uncharacterized protein APZ42_025224 [Daphnia magna]